MRSPKKKLAEFSDIRLIWVQRFRAVAMHQNLERAGQKCDTDATCISDSIQELEVALRIPLVVPTTALLSLHGIRFCIAANKVLSLANNVAPLTFGVTVGALQSLIAVAEHRNYVAAAAVLGLTRDKVMRQISALEEWTGGSVIKRAESGLYCNNQSLLLVAREIISVLKRCRGRDTDTAHWEKRRRRMPVIFSAHGIDRPWLLERQRRLSAIDWGDESHQN